MSDEAMTPEENSAVNDARTAWVHTEPGRFTIEKAFRAAWLAALRYYALKEQHEADARIAAIVRDCDDETRIREIRGHFSLGRSHNGVTA